MSDEVQAECCWLCQRPLGQQVQLHHTVPRAKKGRVTVPVHPICHRTIHKAFTNTQLARLQGSRTALVEDEGVSKFLAWIAGKPADFNAPTH